LSGTVTGCVVVSLSTQVALELASELLDEEMTEVDDDCTDAIGEITNMITGNAKTDFPVEGCTISVPSIIKGQHTVSFPSGIPVISIPCNAGTGQMSVDVGLKLMEQRPDPGLGNQGRTRPHSTSRL
jgi:chemotaxis protein CheX